MRYIELIPGFHGKRYYRFGYIEYLHRISQYSRCGLTKALYMVINVDNGNEFWRFCKRSIILLTLFSTLLRCSSNVSLTSKVTPRFFWEDACKILSLLKTKKWLKVTSWVYFLRSGLKLFYHWKAHLLIFLSLSYQILSKALDISKKTSLTFNPTSNDFSWVMNGSNFSFSPFRQKHAIKKSLSKNCFSCFIDWVTTYLKQTKTYVIRPCALLQ